jgi:hypothetical protein
MSWRPETTRRMGQRVSELIEDFDGCCDEFDRLNLFTGPSKYFHSKSLGLLRQHKCPADAVLDEVFVESVYATLTSWGMHRMGPGGAKLVDFPVFVETFRRLEEPIRQLSAFALLKLNPGDLKSASEQLWAAISEAKIGHGLTKIVAGSKALHHVLPELIPPIDREYTIRFFFHHKALSQGGQVAFQEIYPHFYQMAIQCREKIEARIGQGMNTSVTKVIDNAIVGFVRTHLRVKSNEA